eukprot:gene2128-2620_t
MVHIPILFSLLREEYPQFFDQDKSLKITDSIQEKINSNILLELNKPTSSYCSKFIKNLIDQIEKRDQEVNESILEKFMTLLNPNGGGSDEKEYCYKSYFINGRWITLKNELTYNLVGMTTWGAAYLLTDFILENNDLFQNKKILELGSGTGLIGIVLDFIKPLERVTLTDYSPQVLKNLKVNMIEQNNIIDVDDYIDDEVNTDDNVKKTGNRFSIRALDWEIEDLSILDQCSDFQSDIILGADIVYEPSLCRYLVSILDYLLKKDSNRVAYISSTIRNIDTFNIFREELSKQELLVEDVTTLCSGKSKVFHYDKSSIVLYKISDGKK